MRYKICDNCGKSLIVDDQIEYDDKLFCSKDCLITYMYNKIINLEAYVKFLSWLMKG